MVLKGKVEGSVAHGVNVTIKCKKGHINLGSGEAAARCNDGDFQIIPEDSDPNCLKVGMFAGKLVSPTS